NGCQPGTQPARCRRCNGQGTVIMSQGFFRVHQTCPACGGRGDFITDPCGTCHGQGRVELRCSLDVAIPPGIDTGTRMRLTGEGEAREPGAPRGYLYCTVRVKDHSLFHRDGTSLVCQVPITFSQAALGGDIQVPSQDGPLTHSLKRGIQSG